MTSILGFPDFGHLGIFSLSFGTASSLNDIGERVVVEYDKDALKMIANATAMKREYIHRTFIIHDNVLPLVHKSKVTEKMRLRWIWNLFLVISLVVLVEVCHSVEDVEVSDSSEAVPTENVQSQKQPASRFTKNFDEKKLAKEWEAGDAAEELEQEFERSRKTAEKIQKRKPGFDINKPETISKMMKKDPLAFTAASSGAGGVMCFVELKKRKLDGRHWTKADVDKLTARWTGLLKSGSLPATVFNIGDHEKHAEDVAPRLLMNIDKGWMAVEVMKFALSQPETVKVCQTSTRSFSDLTVDVGDERQQRLFS